MNKLILKKLALAFALGFVPVFGFGLIDILDKIADKGAVDTDILWTALLSLLAGAISAAIRGAIATWTNWMPTDVLHGPGDNPQAVTVTKQAEVIATVPADPGGTP